jgi:hypothetical protein
MKSFLQNLNWDSVSRTLGQVGTAATQISQTAETLANRKNIAAGTTASTPPASGASSGAGNNLALLALGVGLFLVSGGKLKL